MDSVTYRIRVRKTPAGAIAEVVRTSAGVEEVVHNTDPFPCVSRVTARAYEWLQLVLTGRRPPA